MGRETRCKISLTSVYDFPIYLVSATRHVNVRVLQFKIRINKSGERREEIRNLYLTITQNFVQRILRKIYHVIPRMMNSLFLSLFSFIFRIPPSKLTIRLPLIPHRGIDNVRAETC